MDPSSLGRLYDRYYFDHYSTDKVPYRRDERWLSFFGGIADHIVTMIGPRTVLDAGCAVGLLVEALRDRGVDARGIDTSDYALERVRADIRPFCRKRSVTEDLGGPYDLVVCIEVLEHLTSADAEAAVKRLCANTQDILFSSTPTDFYDVTHVNVRPAEYWAELFATQRFVRDVDHDLTCIAPWALRLRRSHDPFPRAIGGYERYISRVIPEILALRQLAIDQRQEVARLSERLEHVESERLVSPDRREDASARAGQSAQMPMTGNDGPTAFWPAFVELVGRSRAAPILRPAYRGLRAMLRLGRR